jgi:maleylacetate reductase
MTASTGGSAQRGVPQGLYRQFAIERVVHGVPAEQAVPMEAERLGATRVFLVSTRSLARNTDAVARIAKGLGQRLAGQFDEIPAHTPREAVIAGAAAARAAGADLIVTVGGGSAIDGSKAMLLALWHNITEASGLDAFTGRSRADPGGRAAPGQSPIRMVAVPTTLSAAEFTFYAGVTDTAKGIKQSFSDPLMVPRTVILDPAITVHTPPRLFFGTGIRAVDHAVERLCSLVRHPFSDATAVEALRLLQSGLPAVQKDPSDLKARLDCQLGAWLSIYGGMAGVPVGASHGIGHVLGAHAGVPHGETSCVMLPSVMTWNRGVNFEEQLRVARAFDRKDDDAAGAVRDLVASLGLPTRLRDVGVAREDFGVIAEKSMHDLAVKTNPRPITAPAEVVEILELAW